MGDSALTSTQGRKRPRSPDVDDFPDEMLVGAPRQVYEFKHMDDLIEIYNQHCKPGSSQPQLECVPRAYEETYLREPVGSERNCINDDQCQGLKCVNCTGFVLREFKLPSQEHESSEGPRQMCIMCRRYEIARIFYRYQALGKPPAEHTTIASYYNLVGVDGEYDIRDCIVSQNGFSGLTMPVVLHTKSAYTQHSEGGVRVFRQTKLRTPGENETKPGPFLARRATLKHASSGVAHSN